MRKDSVMDSLLSMPWDGELLLWLQEYVRNDFLTPVMKFITHLGDKGILWILIAVILLFFKKTRPLGIMAGMALVLSVLINNAIIKNLVARPRPYLPETVGGQGLILLIEKQHDWSFPSGHSGASFAAAVVFLCKGPKKLGIPSIIMAFLIAFSRLYVGVHYPTDVIFGIISGTCCAIISMMIWKIVSERLPEKAANLVGIESTKKKENTLS